jgi:hypothetical protein
MATGTVKLHRVLRTKPERLYRAFLDAGAELDVVQEGIPSVIPVEMCYLGWQESLMQLARLVEPEVTE